MSDGQTAVVAAKIKTGSARPSEIYGDVSAADTISKEEAERITNRIARLETEQQKAHKTIQDLDNLRNKLEFIVSRLENAENDSKQQHAANEKLKEKLAEVIASKEKEYNFLKDKLESMRIKAQHETIMLQRQRDSALAMVKQVRQPDAIETGFPLEKYRSLTDTGAAILAIIGAGAFIALALFGEVIMGVMILIIALLGGAALLILSGRFAFGRKPATAPFTSESQSAIKLPSENTEQSYRKQSK